MGNEKGPPKADFKRGISSGGGVFLVISHFPVLTAPAPLRMVWVSEVYDGNRAEKNLSLDLKIGVDRMQKVPGKP